MQCRIIEATAGGGAEALHRGGNTKHDYVIPVAKQYCKEEAVTRGREVPRILPRDIWNHGWCYHHKQEAVTRGGVLQNPDYIIPIV